MKAPFPYFGGKSRVAAQVWDRFGKIQNYVEPFFGSGAVLLNCPWPGHTETVNDADGLLANFWRALQADPDAVATHCDYPVSEIDLHARHRWLVDRREEVERMLADPDYYDPKAAGWWVWGISQWIGSGWCPLPGGRGETKTGGLPKKRPAVAGQGTRTHGGLGVHRKSLGKMPKIGANGVGSDSGKTGIFRDDVQPPRSYGQLPMLHGDSGATGRGVHSERLASPPASVADVGELYRKLPHVGDAGRGLHRASEAPALYAYLHSLAARLRRVRVVCGDFERVLGPSVTWRHGTTAVFLDPPYDRSERAEVYAVESDAAHRSRAWAIANGDSPLLRIAYCGYDTGEAWPDGWHAMAWKASGGYGSQGDGRGRENASREVVWFSPHCVNDTPLDILLRAKEAPT